MENLFLHLLYPLPQKLNTKFSNLRRQNIASRLKPFLALMISSLIALSSSAQPVIQWQKCLGGNYGESANDSQPTADGGFIFVGHTFSTNNGDVSGGYGGGDFWVVKTDSLANIEWQKALGGSSTDGVRSVCLGSDGGFIVAGSTGSIDGDALSEGHELYEVWIVKLNDSGDIEWEHKYGGSGAEAAYSVSSTIDGGYIFAGVTMSNNGDVYGNQGNDDYWVVKIDQNGVIQWQKPLGGIGADSAWDVQPTNDGGYIVTGGAAGPINSGQFTNGKGAIDFWVVKLNSMGELQWQKALGGSKVDFALSIQQTIDNGFIVAGKTQSLDGDVQGNSDYLAGWVVKLDPNGILQWQKALGGADTDQLFKIFQTSDGGYIASGDTKSNDGDVSGNHGNFDFWVVKLSPESTPTTSPSTQALTLSPNPAQNTLSIQTQESGKTDIQIYNLLGEVLQQQRLEMSDLGAVQVDISQLPTGLYLITATAASGQVYTGRFCKQE